MLILEINVVLALFLLNGFFAMGGVCHRVVAAFAFSAAVEGGMTGSAGCVRAYRGSGAHAL
jgi:hypothetical protein